MYCVSFLPLLNEAFTGIMVLFCLLATFSPNIPPVEKKKLLCLVLFALHVIIQAKFTAFIESLKVSILFL